MKAISLHSPWPYAIFRIGRNIDNRSWAPPEDLIGQRLLIHSAKYFDDASAKALFPGVNRVADAKKALEGLSCVQLADIYRDLVEYPRGGIVGSVVLTGYTKTTSIKGNNWAHGPVVWHFEDAQEFAVPVPYVGGRRLFDVSVDEICDYIKFFCGADTAKAVLLPLTKFVTT